MKDTASMYALGLLLGVYEELICAIPGFVPIDLGEAAEWWRGGRVFSDENQSLVRRLDDGEGKLVKDDEVQHRLRQASEGDEFFFEVK